MRHAIMWLFALLILSLAASPRLTAQGMRFSPEDRAKMLKDSLGLSDKQTEQVVSIFKEMNLKRQALMDSIEDRDARREAMRSLMTKSDDKIESLLDAKQKEKYQTMRKEREARFRQRMN